MAYLLDIIESKKDISLDSGSIISNKELCVSTDTIRGFGNSNELLPQIAYLHSANDIIASGAKPKWATASLSFNRDTQKKYVKKSSLAIADILREHSVTPVNYHSGYYGTESITFTLIGEKENNLTPPTDTTIYLSKPLGGFYNFIYHKDKNLILESSLNHLDIISRFCTISTTDISGYGLISHLYYGAQRDSISINLEREKIRTAIAHKSPPIEMLSSAIKNTPPLESLIDIDLLEESQRIAVFSSETNGPLALFVPTEVEKDFLKVSNENNLIVIPIGNSSPTSSEPSLRVI